MKNINQMIETKKTKKDIKLSLLKEFDKACEDQDFVKLANSLKLGKEILIHYTSKLEETSKELKNCKNCKDLGCCKNKVMGFVDYPIVKNNTLFFAYKACKYQKEDKKEKVSYFEMPKFLKEAKMSEVFIDDKNRIGVIKYIKEFINSFDKNKIKALYLHGSFGSGKSYLISAAINELSKKGYTGVIVYYPTLLKTLKASFGDKLYNKVMEEIINADIILIDDIGAEANSAWARDEVLGTILQTRMDNNASTFFTSNLTLEELEVHLRTTKDGTDKVKAKRIIERIKQLTKEEILITENKRK